MRKIIEESIKTANEEEQKRNQGLSNNNEEQKRSEQQKVLVQSLKPKKAADAQTEEDYLLECMQKVDIND